MNNEVDSLCHWNINEANLFQLITRNFQYIKCLVLDEMVCTLYV